MSRKKKKQKILWDRVIIAVFLLIVVIILIALGIKQIAGAIKNKSDNSSPKYPQTSQLPDNTLNANYDFIKVKQEQIHNGNLILVNSTYKYSGTGENLVNVMDSKSDDYKLSLTTAKLSGDTVTALNALTKDFVAAKSSNDLMIAVTYRSNDEQQGINSSAAGDENKVGQPEYAEAGASEFQSGVSFDFGIFPKNKQYPTFDAKGQYEWIPENAHLYGFIKRYSADKESVTGFKDNLACYRYTGLPHSYYMNSKGICLEEYLDEVKQYKYNTNELSVKIGDSKYNVYYVPSDGDVTDVPVPKKYKYDISGNNIDGFIISYKIS